MMFVESRHLFTNFFTHMHPEVQRLLQLQQETNEASRWNCLVGDVFDAQKGVSVFRLEDSMMIPRDTLALSKALR